MSEAISATRRAAGEPRLCRALSLRARNEKEALMKLPIIALLVASSSSTDRGRRYPSEPPVEAAKRPANTGRGGWLDRLRRRKRQRPAVTR
jgi:hypothetical protein